MFSPTTASSNPYAAPRASTQATRALISSDPNANANINSTPNLHHQPTTNYETAATEAAKTGQATSTTATSAAASMERQSSWKMSDLKGKQQRQKLASVDGGHGFSCTKQ